MLEKRRIINRILADKPRKKWKKYDNSRWNEKYKAIDRKHRKNLKEHNAEILRKRNLQPYEISIYPKGNWREGKKYCSTKSQWQWELEKKEWYKPETKDLFTPTLEKMKKEKDMVIKKIRPAILIDDKKAELFTIKSEEHTIKKYLDRCKIKKGRRELEIEYKEISEIENKMVEKEYEINGVKMTGKDLLEIIIKTGIKIYEVTGIMKEEEE